MTRFAYLDHNASTPVRPEAAAAASVAMHAIGNGSSPHRFGRMVRRLIDDARVRVADLVGAEPSSIVFTSGGTEANSLALCGVRRRRIIASDVEHASVLRATGRVERIPVDGNGCVDLDRLSAMLAKDPRPALVSVMVANNETGVIQPVAEVSAVAKRFSALVHTDAVQAAGKIPVDMRALGADLLSLSAHKIGGLAGAGALVIAPDVSITPMVRGGGQERERRSGTENVVGISAFGAAAGAVRRELVSGSASRLTSLRDDLEDRIRAVAPGSMIFGVEAARLPNTSCLTMPGVSGETQVLALDLDGISVGAGAACSSGKGSRSPVLAAMRIPSSVASEAIRISLGWTSRRDDIDRFVQAWTALYAHTRGRRRASTSRPDVVAAP